MPRHIRLWRDFDHWNNTMKMFIDRAGEYMDGLSVHLYDGINIVGKSSRRSGSNSEAILDLMENYSFIRLGKVLPLAVTEYGGIDNTSKGYHPLYELSLRSIIYCSIFLNAKTRCSSQYPLFLTRPNGI